jgi:hypothetical protein
MKINFYPAVPSLEVVPDLPYFFATIQFQGRIVAEETLKNKDAIGRIAPAQDRDLLVTGLVQALQSLLLVLDPILAGDALIVLVFIEAFHDASASGNHVLAVLCDGFGAGTADLSIGWQRQKHAHHHYGREDETVPYSKSQYPEHFVSSSRVPTDPSIRSSCLRYEPSP